VGCERFGGSAEPQNALKLGVVAHRGRVAQLGEHLLCKQGVAGSNPVTSTNLLFAFIALCVVELSALE
jgi:hypothetical protein